MVTKHLLLYVMAQNEDREVVENCFSAGVLD